MFLEGWPLFIVIYLSRFFSIQAQMLPNRAFFEPLQGNFRAELNMSRAELKKLGSYYYHSTNSYIRNASLQLLSLCNILDLINAKKGGLPFFSCLSDISSDSLQGRLNWSDTLTIFQSGVGQIMLLLILAPSGFSDLPTTLLYFAFKIQKIVCPKNIGRPREYFRMAKQKSNA